MIDVCGKKHVFRGLLGYVIDLMTKTTTSRTLWYSFSSFQSWSWNYYRVVDRFESTITGQFFGHTHFDEMEIFYQAPDYKRPTNVAYIGED